MAKRPATPAPLSLLAAPVNGVVVELGLGATPKPELATEGAATPAGVVVAASVAVVAGAVGVKMIVEGTVVAIVVGLFVTVTIWLGVAV